MKKSYLAALAAGIGPGVWCAHRDKKYPVQKELRFANKLVCPGWVASRGTARFSNWLLDRMALAMPVPPQGVESRRTQIISADGAPVHLTIYRRSGLDWRAPCLVYFHGGGFCIRDQGYIHRYAAQYARGAECAVVFVHYRTADAAPFPAPFEDCYAALRRVWDNTSKLRLDRARIAVGGDSAGGALAAACALRARDEGGPKLCFQLLVYPATDSRMETDSMRKYTDSPLWNAGLNRKMWAIYLRDGDHGMPQCAAPMLASDFSGLPPAYVEVEEFDCLHDEGTAYAKALERAGVLVQLEDVKGAFHGFDFFMGKELAKTMEKKNKRNQTGILPLMGQMAAPLLGGAVPQLQFRPWGCLLQERET